MMDEIIFQIEEDYRDHNIKFHLERKLDRNGNIEHKRETGEEYGDRDFFYSNDKVNHFHLWKLYDDLEDRKKVDFKDGEGEFILHDEKIREHADLKIREFLEKALARTSAEINKEKSDKRARWSN